MSDNIYTVYWESVVPSIIKQFEQGNKTIHIDVNGLKDYGERESYYANFRIVNGNLDIPRNAYAQGRDLYSAFIKTKYFKENLIDEIIQITITKNLKLNMEILATNALDFFREEDFVELEKFTSQTMDSSNGEHKKTYDFLRNTYDKTEYWANQVKGILFPNGTVQVRKRPTNQANKFESYHWAKIYPDKYSFDYKALAFTVGIDNDYQFVIKIDTVGLSESDPRRQGYLLLRGKYTNSEIVKILPADQVLNKDWKYLIDTSINSIKTFKPVYDSLFESFNGVKHSQETKIPTFKKDSMELNTILYGPPGTGKTYCTIEKSIKIANPAFDFKRSNRAQIKKEYQRLVDQGQIQFITFHQSMSYEDFIEGIKPKLSETGSETLSYGIVDGIFKNICKEAFKSEIRSIAFEDEEVELTEDVFKDIYNSFAETLNPVTEEESNCVLTTPNGSKFGLFKNLGGSISVKSGWQKTKLSVSFNELKKVLFENKLPIYVSYEHKIIDKLLENKQYKKVEIKEEKKNFVLIIDEINRGNIAQIFGELITLIEPDKRKNATEELSVILPYSKLNFSVPNNLFLIGTMNTADRSVEALDTALRRRFVFEEMMPKPALLSPQCILWELLWKYESLDWADEPYLSKETEMFELLGVNDEEEIEGIWDKIRKDKKKTEDQVSYFDEVKFSGINLEKMLTTINSSSKLFYQKITLLVMLGL